jgi:hypothetical protein
MKSGMDYSRVVRFTRKYHLQSTLVRRLDCGKPAHIYKKRDFSNDDSMEKRILLVVCNWLYITTSCDSSKEVLTRRLMASRGSGCDGR